jgi:pyridoxamine 5'-phosphate oxidase
MDIGHFRREFLKGGLNRADLDPDPVLQFSVWFEQARQTDIVDPNGMVLATVSREGQPSQRTVLLKYFDESGFVFFTNYGSRKAREIATNNRVSLLFCWYELDRQIQINGTAAKISVADSTRYFLSRPPDSRIAAWVSNQSHALGSRQALLQKFLEMKKKFGEGTIPLPSFWGGYRVFPAEIEFWQGRENRLHDRFLYSRQQDQSWTIERLSP